MQDAANDQWCFVHNDHLGTPKLVTDDGAKVVWRGEAAAFGATGESGAMTLAFRFPGQVEDASTGYFYNYFRDYDPSLGRYLQSDPIGLNGGVNTFAYVLGNPVFYLDLYGLDTLGFTAGGIGTKRHVNINNSYVAAIDTNYNTSVGYASEVGGSIRRDNYSFFARFLYSGSNVEVLDGTAMSLSIDVGYLSTSVTVPLGVINDALNNGLSMSHLSASVWELGLAFPPERFDMSLTVSEGTMDDPYNVRSHFEMNSNSKICPY